MRGLQSVLVKLLLALVLASMVVGCTAKARKARLIKRAESYFKTGEYDKAKIEYLNVLRSDNLNADAICQLGLIWYEEGAPLRALPFLMKARELSPNDLALREKLAQALIAVGHFAEARKEAIAILQQSPNDEDAILLLIDTGETKEDSEYTEQQLQKFPRHDSASFFLATAAIALRKGDLASAECALKQAIALDARSSSAYVAMANISLLRKDSAGASEELKIAADLVPIRSSVRLRFAEIKAQAGSTDEAKAILHYITSRAPDYLPAWRLLAQFAFTEKKYGEALTLLENVFRRDSANLDACMLEAEVWLAKGETKKAVEGFEQLNRAYPNVPVIKYQLARAYVQDNNIPQASTALTEAIVASPDYVEANLLLGELNLRRGDAQPVVAAMQRVLKTHPDLRQAQLLLTDAFRSLGRFNDAAAIVREQIRISPESAQPHLLLGVILRQQGKTAEARQAFEKAAKLAPDDPRVLSQIVDLDIAEKSFATALQRVQAQLHKTPTSAEVQFAEAKIYAAQKDWDRAEAALLKTLDLDPNDSLAYDLLISTYLSANKMDAAIGQLEGLLAKHPDNSRALMMTALIYGRKQDYPKARDSYEKLLAKSPNFVPALNDLAYYYDERFNLPDKAYDLARKARSLQPGDPATADTLGWILYKRADYQQALALIQESAGKLPNNPEVQFHLGMACYMMGRGDAAQAALQQAANAAEDFPGKEEAQRRLASLENSLSVSKELSTDELEATLKQQPDDLFARMRLGESYEKQGAFGKAAAACEEALKLNPKLLPSLVKLAQLNAGPLQDKDKALEFAKKAREMTPSDPHSGGVLGSIAYQTGNFPWAYSLLQESARQLPGDTRILHDFAWAAYSLGKVSEAQEAMQRVLNGAPGSRESDDAKTFLAMIALEQNPKGATAAEDEVSKLLRADPGYAPALMARAAIQAQRGDSRAPADAYNEVLRRFSDFSPAQKRLAALYAEDPNNQAKAYELAMKARKTLPDDPELAETLAEISYQRKEYPYALQLLRESAAKQPLDAKHLYYLGMSSLQLKQKASALEAFQKALAAGLQEPFANEAKHRIGELQRK